MSYGGIPYAGGPYAGTRMVVADVPVQTQTTVAIEVAFTTDALDPNPAWVDISGDCRWWDTTRGRNRELERFQPGRATIVLGNRERQYDAVNAAGPWFGYLKANRRVRIRETFNGVTYPIFDGFIDKWKLDYPGVGHDATATITATDAFKLFARTDLPRSVYAMEVDADAPAYWWRLNENLGEGAEERNALNHGTVGTPGNGVYVGAVDPGAQGLIVNDPDTSLYTSADTVTPGVPVSGVDLPATLSFLERFNDRLPFAIEFWARPQEEALASYALFQRATTPAISNFYILWFTDPGNTGQFLLNVGAESMETGNNTAPPGTIYHVVARFVPNGANMDVTLWLDGVQKASATFTGTPNEGGIQVNAIGHSSDANNNWTGRIGQVAVYTAATGDALTPERIAVHNAAGRHPWQGDTPKERADRILDLVGLPESMRELDVGGVTFQSASLH